MNIIFEKNQFPGFRLKSVNSEVEFLLANFLLQDAIWWIDEYKKWALDPTQKYSSGNESFLSKEDTYIYIYSLFSTESETEKHSPKEPHYKISPKDFITFLDEWKTTITLKPNFIVITENNNKLTVTTKQSDPQASFLIGLLAKTVQSALRRFFG